MASSTAFNCFRSSSRLETVLFLAGGGGGGGEGGTGGAGLATTATGAAGAATTCAFGGLLGDNCRFRDPEGGIEDLVILGGP